MISQRDLEETILQILEGQMKFMSAGGVTTSLQLLGHKVQRPTVNRTLNALTQRNALITQRMKFWRNDAWRKGTGYAVPSADAFDLEELAGCSDCGATVRNSTLTRDIIHENTCARVLRGGR